MRRRRDQIPLASFCEWVIEVHAAYAMISQVYSTMVLMSCILFEIMITWEEKVSFALLFTWLIRVCARAQLFSATSRVWFPLQYSSLALLIVEWSKFIAHTFFLLFAAMFLIAINCVFACGCSYILRLLFSPSHSIASTNSISRTRKRFVYSNKRGKQEKIKRINVDLCTIYFNSFMCPLEGLG